MKCTFEITRDNVARFFKVRIEGSVENPIRSVETRYEGLILATDTPLGPVTTFERTYRKQEGMINPGTRELFVTAELENGSESFTKIWDE